MFVLAESENYFWPVTVEVPVSGGKHDKVSFDVEFKPASQKRLKEVLAPIITGQPSKVSDADFCAEIVVGWKGIVAADKTEIPFSFSSLEKLLDKPMVAKAIVTAYLDSVSGSGAKAKN